MSFEEMCAAEVKIASHLPFAERLLLWAVRAWSAHHSDLSGVWWSLDRAFTDARIRPALEPFHSMMSTLYTGLIRWPDIRCVGCPQLGEDEARLLMVVARLQQNQRSWAYSALRGLTAPSATRKTCDAAVEMVRVMNASQLTLSIEPDLAIVIAANRPQSWHSQSSVRP